jgi:hypothetical protein
MKPLILGLIASTLVFAQRNAIDWPFAGNDAQRTGWEKSDSSITMDNVKDFKLVMKMSLDPKVKGARSFSAPVVLGRIISYRGFKELAFVQSSSDGLWAIDADMNRVFWEKHFEKPSHTPKNTGPNAAMCSGSVAAMPSLMPAPVFAPRQPGAPPAPRPAPPANAAKSLLSAGGFGGPRPAFAISSDGKLHLMNTSTGEDVTTAMSFIPPGAKASSLTVSNGVAYTTTIAGCGGVPAGVWAIDLNGEEPKVSSFPVKAGDLRGIAFGTEGTVFAQTTDSVVALAPKTLQISDSFKAPGGMANTTPVVFTWQNHELVVAAGKNGQLYVLDPKALKTSLSETASAGTIWGGLSSWQGADGTRWVLAPTWGPKAGAIVAYRLVDSNGVPTLTQAWTSHDLASPEPPVITSGIVFALSAGEYANENAKPTGHATLFAFDGVTGKELYSSGDQASAPANLTGVTLANGRVFFTTTDGTLYGFGIYLER